MDLPAECLPCGPRWPQVSQETAHCVTLHFVSCMASYFWKMWASTLVAWAYFVSVCVCKACITALSLPQCPVEIHHYLPEGTADISLSFNPHYWICWEKMLHAYICVQQGWGWYLYVEEKEYVACHLLLFSSLLHSDEASNIYGSHTFPRALANMQIHTWWFPSSFFHTVMQADTLRHTLSCTVYKA